MGAFCISNRSRRSCQSRGNAIIKSAGFLNPTRARTSARAGPTPLRYCREARVLLSDVESGKITVVDFESGGDVRWRSDVMFVGRVLWRANRLVIRTRLATGGFCRI